MNTLTSRNPLFWWLVTSVGLMVVGAIGPWARALGVFSANGLDGDGWFVLGAAIAAAVMLSLNVAGVWPSPWPLVVMTIVGVVAAAAAIVDLEALLGTQRVEFFGEEADVVAPGWGIWVSALSSVSLVLAAAVAFVLGGRPAQAPR